MTRTGNSSKMFGIFSNTWERLLPGCFLDKITGFYRIDKDNPGSKKLRALVPPCEISPKFRAFSAFRDKKATLQSRPVPLKRKPLRLESLEDRVLLAVLLETPYGPPAVSCISACHTEQDIAVCPPYNPTFEEVSRGAVPNEGAVAAYSLDDTFYLHSNPGSKFTIYLDFTGHTTVGTSWNTAFTSGATIVTPAYDTDGNPNSFSNTELLAIQRAWSIVAEDFIAFDVNVTTEEPPLDRLIKSGTGDDAWGIRVVIGGSCDDWYTGSAGGVAYLDSFNRNSDTPCFIFEESGFSWAGWQEAISHEVGHTLGLSHDGNSLVSGDEEYYSGTIGWAPIMGASYDQPLTQWSKGEYNGATNTQDDLDVITRLGYNGTGTVSNPGNGFTYRVDDHGNTTGTATSLTLSGGLFTGNGIIERNTDVDIFSFTTIGGSIAFTITGIAEGSNLDIKAELLNSAGSVIYTSNPTDSINATISTNIDAGTYYIRISGDGKGNPTTNGYSNYGSLGQYTITERAISLVVTTLTDVVNPNDGLLSLREAIDQVFIGGTVSFASNLAGGTIILAGTELVINKSITIDASNLYNAATKTPGITISGNNASRVFNILGNSGNVLLTALTITGGNTVNGGGGIYNSGTLTVMNCTINENNTTNRGGGIYNSGSNATLTITNSTVSGNHASDYGGGIHNSSGTLTIMNSTVSGNNAPSSYGGGISNSSGTLTLMNSTVSGNHASYGGGIFHIGSNATLTIINSTISGNSASSGGGIWHNNGILTITNSTISGNNASSTVGGIYNSSGILTITNSTISGNSASSYGGIYNSGTTTLHNTIVAKNSGDIYQSGTLTGSHNLIGNGTNSGLTNGTNGNIIGTNANPVDPKFVLIPTTISASNTGLNYNASNWNLRLQSNSPAIDQGANTLAKYVDNSPILYDLAGNARIAGGIVDIGAYEYSVLLLSITVTNTNDSGPGSLRQAIADIAAGGTITFAGNLAGQTITLAGTELAIDKSITIDASGLYNATTKTPGITISGNNASRVFFIFGEESNVSLIALTISGGNAETGGGGISNGFSTLTIMNCIITGNSAEMFGGGILNFAGTMTITGSTISGNTATSYDGGGIWNNSESGTVTITNCTISGNNGGGIVNSGTLTMANSTISGNNGGGICNYYGMLTVMNSTISGNNARYGYGGGILNNGELILCNTIVAKNSSDINSEWGSIAGANNLIGDGTNSCLTNGINGNIIGTTEEPIDPRFGELTEINGHRFYPLLAGSPAIANGNIQWLPEWITADIIGNPRTTDGTICIGALEGATLTPRAAVTYYITSLDDENLPDGAYSFKQAFEAASLNKQAGNAPAGSFTEQDKIIFAPGLTGTICLAGKQLEIFGSLVIDASSANITIDARQQSRVIYIEGEINVELINLTITGGNADVGGGIYNTGLLIISNSIITGNSAEMDGGGIYNSGTLTITNCTISNNNAMTGGGIYNSDFLAVTNSTINENNAGHGGGIFNYGTVTVTNSTISGNNAGIGGGIYNSYHGTLMTVTNSTISGNNAGIGGGIYNSYHGTLTVTNSTISGNTASYGGGGIYNGIYSTLTITNSTISGNTAEQGGGIYNYDTTILYNTIIAKNSTDIYHEPDVVLVDGTVTGSNNLIGNGSNSGLTNNVNGNIVGTTANPIDPLFVDAENGDYRLRFNSPAVNSGNNAWAKYADNSPILYDLAGNPRISDITVDIGAYEYPVIIPVLPAPVLNTPTGISASGLSLAWNAIANAGGYSLQYRVLGDTDWICVTGTIASPQAITGLIAATQYEFRIMAIGDAVAYIDSDWSAIQTVWTLCNAPSGVSAAGLGTTSIQLDWSVTPGATGYIVEQSANGTTGWTTVTTTVSNTFTATGILPYTTLYYRVTAVNPSGNSAVSQTVGATTDDYVAVSTPYPAIMTQEGCSFYLQAVDIFGENLTYWWDLSGTGEGTYVQISKSFWVNVDTLGFTPGEYTIRMFAQNSRGTQSEQVSIALSVVALPATFNVTKTTLLGEQIIILDIDGYFRGGRVPQSWTVNWGDSGSSGYTAATSFIKAIYYYPQKESDTAYPITLTIVNSYGATETYFLGTHVVPGSATHVESALPVVLGELFTPRHEGTELLGEDLFVADSFIATGVSDSITETIAGYSAVSWFDPAFALIAQSGLDSFTRLSRNEENLLPVSSNSLIDASLTDWFDDFAIDEIADETIILESIGWQQAETSESKSRRFDTQFDCFDTLFEEWLV